MNEKDKKTSQILAFLFGGIFMLIFFYLLSKLIYRIYIESKRNRINRRQNQLLLANSLYHIT